ncbi:MAG: hypothetical protein ACO3JL_20730, partial [Myxococcota bacterium]
AQVQPETRDMVGCAAFGFELLSVLDVDGMTSVCGMTVVGRTTEAAMSSLRVPWLRVTTPVDSLPSLGIQPTGKIGPLCLIGWEMCD